MLRSFTLQPLSVVVGAAFSGLVLLSMSQAPPLNANSIGIQYLPYPRDMVQVRAPMPFVVPAGKVFVLTGLGSSGAGSVTFYVDGQPEASYYTNNTTAVSVQSVALGFTAPAGSTITVANGGSNDIASRAWGYLAPQ